MMEGSSGIDLYIAKSQPFAQPILETLRAHVRAALPEVEEALKWNSPTFLYKGKILCSMAAFKEHATFGFWHGTVVTGGTARRMTAMGDLGRITSVDQLPGKKAMAAWVEKAKQLIDDGVKPPHIEGRGKQPKPDIATIPAFQAALDANRKAKAIFESFPPSCRREYLEWILDAKRNETRENRIAQAVEWMEEGKRRHWKYENC